MLDQINRPHQVDLELAIGDARDDVSMLRMLIEPLAEALEDVTLFRAVLRAVSLIEADIQAIEDGFARRVRQ